MKIFCLPVNNLSFGNVSFGLLNELYKCNITDIILKDIGDPNLSAFDKRRNDDKFINWLNTLRADFLSRYKNNYPSFRMWHINGSESSYSKDQSLFCWHELDQITPVELNILNQHKHIFVSSNYTKQVFEDGGVEPPITVLGLGFDDLHFVESNDRKKIPDDVCVWYHSGKFEKRKRTEEIIRLWKKKFGGNQKHLLNLMTYNSFRSPEDNNALLANALNGYKDVNINILPFYETLSEVNQIMNMSDITIALSGGEGWDLPLFNSLCLGKHAVAHYATGPMDYLTEENSVLVQSTGKEPMQDGVFFAGQGDFNIGNVFTWDEDAASEAMDAAYKRWQGNRVNEAGKKLKERFTWKGVIDKVLEVL